MEDNNIDHTKKRRNICFKLFLTMLKIGAFTFGGGYAMIALLETELVSKRGWIGHDEFLDMVAISESTPGPIAINIATYIGHKLGGTTGAVASTAGMVIPSFVIIYIISLIFDKFISFKYVDYAFKGIQICVVYLILSAGLKFLKEIKKGAFNIIVLISVTAAMLGFSVFAVDFSSIIYILICGAAGVATYLIRNIGAGGDKRI